MQKIDNCKSPHFWIYFTSQQCPKIDIIKNMGHHAFWKNNSQKHVILAILGKTASLWEHIWPTFRHFWPKIILPCYSACPKYIRTKEFCSIFQFWFFVYMLSEDAHEHQYPLPLININVFKMGVGVKGIFKTQETLIFPEINNCDKRVFRKSTFLWTVKWLFTFLRLVIFLG